MRLAERVAIVTGGGKGIGRAIARRFALEGARVVIAQRDVGTLERTAAEIRAAGGEALPVPTDVSREAACEALVDAALRAFGQVDILVNNAALSAPPRVEFPATATEVWRQTLAVNLDGMFYCGRAAARHMVPRGCGRIVNVLAIQAWVPLPHNAPYAASKGGGVSLTRSMAIDLAPHGIIVNAIAPGPIYVAHEEVPPEVDASAATLVRRAGRASEVAALALFLASEECTFVVGQTIVCDGGRLLSRRGDPGWV
ncbi:MAG: SDR family oxidoreductase [Chloroflexi bacterium]|nr:SDR family oxidoreductase [Chloroflexota bacterium]